jgi:tripartite-type tricarboxylate transporter receptor subunit TctC
LLHVPYKGTTQAINDVIGGQVDCTFSTYSGASAALKSGKVRALAVPTAPRWPGTPDIPTVAETVPGYEVAGWFGLLAPAGTPPAIVDALQKAVAAAVAKPEVKKQLLDVGAQPVANTPAAFATQISDDVARWKKVAQATGVKLD